MKNPEKKFWTCPKCKRLNLGTRCTDKCRKENQ